MENKYAYSKRFIIDIDDTISFTTSRDWENARPDLQVINKINKLYDQGWEIWLVTARGQLSCGGDPIKADAKYGKIIREWMTKHGVHYHKISFQKFLGAYYVDDKALTPEEFIKLDIRRFDDGWSGAAVEKRGDRIYKTHKNSLDAAKWYEMAAPFVNVPVIHSLVGKTLCMEYLENNEQHFKLDDVNKAIETFSLAKPNNIPFSTYMGRIIEHCDVNNDFHEILDLLDADYKFFNDHSSFMHGDMSLDNLIQTDKGLYFIDPIYSENQWSSYLLDITKMMHSYRRYNRMFEYEIFTNTWAKKLSISKYLLQLLEITQWIRVIKYIPAENSKQEFHKKTKQMIKDIIKNKKI